MAGQQSPTVAILEGAQSSGKTGRLLEHARALLDDGCDVADLMVVCASKDAAAAFKRRLGFRVSAGPESVERLRVVSARALSYEVLVDKDAQAMYGHGPRTLLDVERSILIADLRQAGMGKEDLAAACKELYRAWDTGELPAPQGEPARRYADALASFGAYDVRELGARALNAVRSQPEIAQRLGAAHVLVDDANLIGLAQLRLIEALAGQELLLAGDCSVANPFFDAAATGTSLARFAQACAVEPVRLAQAPLDFPENTFVVKSPEPLTEAITCSKTVKYILGNVAVDLSQDLELAQAASAAEEAGTQVAKDGCEPIPFDDLVYPNEVCAVIPQGSMLKDVCQKLKAAGIATVTCTEGQPVGGDPRRVASVATLQSFTLLGLAANERDLMCWRTWVGLGRADISAKAWAGLVAYAAERGTHVLDTLASLDASAPEPFEGAELLAKRYAQARALIVKASRKHGRQLIDIVSPNENLTFTRLCEPVVAQDAGEFFARANLGAVDRGFGGRLWDVRVGIPAAFAGLETKACVLLGLNEGVAPRATREESPVRFENECRLWRGLLHKARNWLTMSYVQGVAPDHALALGARVKRAKRAATGDIAMLAPSVLLRELGMAEPSTMGAQQFVACVLEDTL